MCRNGLHFAKKVFSLLRRGGERKGVKVTPSSLHPLLQKKTQPEDGSTKSAAAHEKKKFDRREREAGRRRRVVLVKEKRVGTGDFLCKSERSKSAMLEKSW